MPRVGYIWLGLSDLGTVKSAPWANYELGKRGCGGFKGSGMLKESR